MSAKRDENQGGDRKCQTRAGIPDACTAEQYATCCKKHTRSATENLGEEVPRWMQERRADEIASALEAPAELTLLAPVLVGGRMPDVGQR